MNPLTALIDVWWARPYMLYTIGKITMGQLIISILKRLAISAIIIGVCGYIFFAIMQSDNTARFKKIGITEEQLEKKRALMITNGKYDPNFFMNKENEEDAVDMRLFGKIMGSEYSASFWEPKQPTTRPDVVSVDKSSEVVNIQPPTQHTTIVHEDAPVVVAATLPDIEPIAPKASSPIVIVQDSNTNQPPNVGLPHADKPGFNCSAAHSNVEHMICDNQELIDADSMMTKKYQKMEKSDNNLIAHKNWIRERNSCTSVNCLNKSYSYRLKELM